MWIELLFQTLLLDDVCKKCDIKYISKKYLKSEIKTLYQYYKIIY